MNQSEAIEKFWQLFRQRAAALAQLSSADDPVYDELLEQLHQVDAGLFIEFSTAQGDRELIITAEGDRELFGLADCVVAAAPQVEGWTVIALKPKLGLPRSMQWAGLRVDLSEVVFEPLTDEESDELGLRLLVPELEEDDRENVGNALLRVLDHLLGERQFAENVQYVELERLEEPADEYLPLVEVEQFLEWHAKQRRKH